METRQIGESDLTVLGNRSTPQRRKAQLRSRGIKYCRPARCKSDAERLSYFPENLRPFRSLRLCGGR
jgi:hypothetical protein